MSYEFLAGTAVILVMAFASGVLWGVVMIRDEKRRIDRAVRSGKLMDRWERRDDS